LLEVGEREESIRRGKDGKTKRHTQPGERREGRINKKGGKEGKQKGMYFLEAGEREESIRRQESRENKRAPTNWR